MKQFPVTVQICRLKDMPLLFIADYSGQRDKHYILCNIFLQNLTKSLYFLVVLTIATILTLSIAIWIAYAVSVVRSNLYQKALLLILHSPMLTIEPPNPG